MFRTFELVCSSFCWQDLSVNFFPPLNWLISLASRMFFSGSQVEYFGSQPCHLTRYWTGKNCMNLYSDLNYNHQSTYFCLSTLFSLWSFLRRKSFDRNPWSHFRVFTKIEIAEWRISCISEISEENFAEKVLVLLCLNCGPLMMCYKWTRAPK